MPEFFDYSKTYYKIINPNDYRLGLNVNPLGMGDDPRNPQISGGIWFTDRPHLGKFYDGGDMVAEIKVPQDAVVIRAPEMDRWITDKIEILKFIDKIEFLFKIGPQKGSLNLINVKSLKNVNIPDVKKSVYLPDAIEIENVKFGRIGYQLYLNKLIKIKNVKFGDINGSLYLNKISEIKNINFPKIGEDLDISGAERIEDAMFEEIKGNLYLSKIKIIKNANFADIKGDLYLNGIKRIENVVFGKIWGDLYADSLPANFDRTKVRGKIVQIKGQKADLR